MFADIKDLSETSPFFSENFDRNWQVNAWDFHIWFQILECTEVRPRARDEVTYESRGQGVPVVFVGFG